MEDTRPGVQTTEIPFDDQLPWMMGEAQRVFDSSYTTAMVWL